MPEKPNRLINELSPYLLQHAYNPVDWYPWGDEAFDRARQEDKPIFLSIGYSTCHWCHVMAHESFEDPGIAELLNKWFVSVKVDREERPDIDQMYMAATHAMAGAGGWPMSVFLTPDGSPFYAGTYFPPRSAHQRPGFADLLNVLHQAWEERRMDIERAAVQVVAHLAREERPAAASIPPDTPQRCYDLLEKNYDPEHGGFGQAPKFPRPAVFAFLFGWYRQTGKEEAKAMALHTLRKMADGGMYDQIGGGFHRYSVDHRWFVPHFEKMLYDQGQLAQVYLDAFLQNGDRQFARVAEEIFAYMLRDMQHPEGGFYSAEDADSVNPYDPAEHGEGAFYLWTEEEIRARLDPAQAELFCFVYGVEKNGNVARDPLGEFSGRNILYRAGSTEEAAKRFDIAPAEIESRLAAARQVLLQVRESRTRPHRDDKIVTGWNGMFIGALARGGKILGRPELLAAAIRAADFVEANLFDPTNATLLRRWRAGEAGLVGQLDDYSYLAGGLLDLYQATHDPHWLEWAELLTETQIVLFWHESGGYFYDSAACDTVKIRLRGAYDGAEPAGNSMAVHNLLRLARLRGRDDWRGFALRSMQSFAENLAQYPPALPLLLAAWLRRDDHAHVVVTGEREAADTEALLIIAQHAHDPHRPVLLADGDTNQAFLAEKLPFLNSIRPEGPAMAHVCRDFSCSTPTGDPDELRRLLAKL